ncbi:MAG: GNAT family N-acetyltransferase, partial [Anaerolineales bacterium]
MMTTVERLSFQPLIPERWPDFEQLFGAQGASGGCWCMWWRIARREFEANGNQGNRDAMRSLVEAGHIPGILAYHGDCPVGWCSIAPRSEFGALERSRVLKRIDDEPVWSIVCFYISKPHRHQGLLR